MNKYRFMEAASNAGYTQVKLARKLKMSKNTLNSKINGHIPFTTFDIERICDILSISEPEEKAKIFLT